VDAEIPSPAAGTLLEISVKEGETVAVNSVVATIGAAGEGAAAAPPAVVAAAPAPAATAPPPSGKAQPHTPQADGTPAATPTAPAAAAPSAAIAPAPAAPNAAASTPSESDRPRRSSPLVRRIAKEHGVDIGAINGSGIGGRVTKQDILGYLEHPTPASASARPGSAGELRRDLAEAAFGREGGPAAPGAPVAPGAPGSASGAEVVPMSVMRKKIAEHMVLSKRTSAHVYSVFEVNFSKVDEIRKARRADFEARGVKLTFTSFIAKVAVDTLRRHKTINASIDGDNVVYKREINLGMAVALENGLIVPVVKRADELNILGLSRAIADVADRARAKKLNPDEVHGGTFTITNPGNFGAQFGLPIINQPQVAILGVGTIEKRPVVIDDMIGIRLMGYLTLGYDHRLVDGAVADQFMADLKKALEGFDPAQA
jgi:2-oxoglutarate dehydrogenase E2 component (dihydrolipoamide succinyltransferase)